MRPSILLLTIVGFLKISVIKKQVYAKLFLRANVSFFRVCMNEWICIMECVNVRIWYLISRYYCGPRKKVWNSFFYTKMVALFLSSESLQHILAQLEGRLRLRFDVTAANQTGETLNFLIHVARPTCIAQYNAYRNALDTA